MINKNFFRVFLAFARSFENSHMAVIYIYNSKVTDIQPRTFYNTPNLKSIWITGNSISIIRKGVFNNKNIETIYLRKNKIQYVEPEAFLEIKNLRFLSLEENEIAYFEPNLIIGFNPTLEYLYINRNQLSEVNREMFSTLPNLRILLLNINFIEHIEKNAFIDLKELYLLDLSHNQIEEIRPDIFPPKNSKLVKLFLHDNKLTYVSSGVLVRLPNLKEISATGNPWQCPCQEHFRAWLFEANIARICDREVKNGERPSCVIHPKEFTQCVYDLENSRDVVEYYEESIKEYPVLPSVCETDGKVIPSLGD